MENNKILAYILIGVGALFLLSRLDMDTGWLWIGLVGAAFLWGYVSRKSYGLLVAGSVLTGVAVGLLLEESWGMNGAFLVSLGVGFAMIDRIEPKKNRWPLYVGALLGLFGLVVGLSETGVLGSFWFALVLIGAGAYLLGQNKEVGPSAPPTGYAGGTPPETFVTPGPQPTETVASGLEPTAAPTPSTATPSTVTPSTATPSATATPSRVDVPSAAATPAVDSPADSPVEAPLETAPVQAVDPVLYERLEAWRRETAKHEDRAAYLVLTNESLRQVAAEKPQTLDALKSVKGIGPVKLERYGSALLDLVRAA